MMNNPALLGPLFSDLAFDMVEGTHMEGEFKFVEFTEHCELTLDDVRMMLNLEDDPRTKDLDSGTGCVRLSEGEDDEAYFLLDDLTNAPVKGDTLVVRDLEDQLWELKVFQTRSIQLEPIKSNDPEVRSDL
jgi:hypothetical protein